MLCRDSENTCVQPLRPRSSVNKQCQTNRFWPWTRCKLPVLNVHRKGMHLAAGSVNKNNGVLLPSSRASIAFRTPIGFFSNGTKSPFRTSESDHRQPIKPGSGHPTLPLCLTSFICSYAPLLLFIFSDSNFPRLLLNLRHKSKMKVTSQASSALSMCLTCHTHGLSPPERLNYAPRSRVVTSTGGC